MNPPRAAFFGRQTLPRAALFRHLLQLLILGAIPCLVTAGQTVADPDDEVVRVRTDLVTVPVSVSDARGRRVAGLSQADFTILDGGRPVAISYFAGGAARVSLLFAVDTSGSTYEIIKRQQDAALALYARFGANSRAGILIFADKPTLALPFTSEFEQVRAAFDFSAQANRHTAIFDAALAAARSFNALPSDSPERRIVVLLSDGLDTASRTRAKAVVEAARQQNISFYVIHIPLYTPRGGRLAVRSPAKGFRELAAQTGGHYFLLGDAREALNPNPAVDLGPVFDAIAADLQSQYLIGYYLDETTRDRREHRIEVKLVSPAHRKFRVQNLREGYHLKP